MKTYKATIHLECFEDSFSEGEIGSSASNWTEEFECETKAELREKICEVTYSKWEDILHEDMGNSENASEYWASYLTDEANNGEARQDQIELWKKGELRLWSCQCHILVSEVETIPTTL